MLNSLVDSGQPLSTPDIQGTSFSIDAIARFVCNTWDEMLAATSPGNEFDIIVIGSGMYGGYFASKLFQITQSIAKSEMDRPRILVLEAGPYLIPEHVQNMPRLGDLSGVPLQDLADNNQSKIIENGGKPEGLSKHHQCVGGKSPFWGGWAPELTDDDLKQWPKEVADFLRSQDGYQAVSKDIGTNETTDFIKGKLQQELKTKCENIVKSGKVPNLFSVLEAPIAVQADAPRSGLFSMDKYSSVSLLLDSIREDIAVNKGKNAQDNTLRRLMLVPGVEVLRCETKQGRVQDIIASVKSFVAGAKPSIKKLKVSSQAMVVFAGNTVNSTRLALNSFKRGPREQELMGRNLMAHVRGNFVWSIDKSVFNVNGEAKTSALHIQGATNGNGPKGRFHFQFYASGNPECSDNSADEFLYRAVPNVEDIEPIRNAQQAGRIAVGIRTCGETFGDKLTSVGQPDKSWIDVNPHKGFGDDVYFDDQGKEIRVPKVYVHLVEGPGDGVIRQAQTKAAKDFVNAITNGQSDKILCTKEDEDGIGTTYHECGTLWMGEDPSSSVTDLNARFHHVNNAMVVDQSLFPTAGSANPVPTGLALARKAARAVINRYSFTAPKKTLGANARRPLDAGITNNHWHVAGPNNFRFLKDLSILEVGRFDGISELGLLWYEDPRGQSDRLTLEVEWKAFSQNANSGIFVRMDRPKQLNQPFYDSAIEVQIDESGFNPATNSYGSALHRTGSVYEILPATRWATKAPSPRFSKSPGYWNLYRIELNKNQIKVWLNDVVVSQGTIPNNRVTKGFFGFQCHTGIVQYRNLNILT